MLEMPPVLGSHRQRTYLEDLAGPRADARVLALFRLRGHRATGITGILARPGVEESLRAELAEGGVVRTHSGEESSRGTGTRW